MKLLKLGVLVCGALGIVGLLTFGIGMMLEAERTGTIVVLIAFALPVVMAGIALIRPPMQPWQAGISLAGFALAAWKVEIWKLIELDAERPVGQWLVVIGALAGVVVSIAAILKPETA